MAPASNDFVPRQPNRYIVTEDNDMEGLLRLSTAPIRGWRHGARDVEAGDRILDPATLFGGQQIALSLWPPDPAMPRAAMTIEVEGRPCRNPSDAFPYPRYR